MTDALPISEAVIRQSATATSFSRGEDYYRRGAVVDIARRGNTIQAAVEGSEVTPYRVALKLDSAGITSATCTCLYNYEGWCKHCVATALAWARQPQHVETRPTLAQLLDRLDLVQTQGLVQELVEEHPELLEWVDRHVSLISHPTPTPTSAPRRTTLDATPFRKQVKQILRQGLRYLEEDYEDDPFTDDLLKIVEKAQEFSRNNDGNSAIAILEAVTATYAAEWNELLDYGGDCYSIADTLNEAWAEAILSAELSPAETVDLEVLLQEWQDTLDADFSVSLAALQQAWTDPELQRALRGNGYSHPNRLTTSFGQDLALIRLQILDRQGRQQEYLNLARIEGLMLPYLTKSVAIGNLEEAMTTAPEQITTPEAAFTLAQVLREHNHLAEALAIAQVGLSSSKKHYELARWTSDLASGLGNQPVALNASIVAFEARPSFADYRRVESFAAEAWHKIRSELLQTLRQYRDWGAEQAKISIFLHESLIDDAIQTVQTSSYMASDLIQRVMQAALSHHPDWVIAEAGKRAEPIISQGKADRYREAVQWLTLVKAAYGESGRSAWEAYFNPLRELHSRKRKLMELFKAL